MKEVGRLTTNPRDTAESDDQNTKTVPDKPRRFSFMGPGSILSSIFSLFNSTIGVGILLHPLIFNELGIILGLSLMFIACALSFTGIIGVITSAESTTTTTTLTWYLSV